MIWPFARKPTDDSADGSAKTVEDARRKQLGRVGEEAAVRELLRRHYRIIDRNYLCRTGEIDIIAEHNGTLVFVEVKTRSSRSWEDPLEAVTPQKQDRIYRAARHFMAGYRVQPRIRFDVVSIITDPEGGAPQVSLLENAFGFVNPSAPPPAMPGATGPDLP